MANRGNPGNLKRGGITPEAQRKGLEAMKRGREERDALLDKAREDPYAAYHDMHKQMTAHILKLLKEEAREGGLPKAAVTDRLREYRQLTAELNTYLERKGELDAAGEMFAHLEERLAQANFDEDSPDAPTRPERDQSPPMEAPSAPPGVAASDAELPAGLA